MLISQMNNFFCGLRSDETGVTLIELVVVIVIAGILSYVVVSSTSSTSSAIQYTTMIEKLASDVRYARELATTQGRGTRVIIDVSNNRYYLTWSDGSYIPHPVGGANMIQQLGIKDFADVSITGTSFSGGRLDFTRSGKPQNAGADFQGERTLVILNGKKKIQVTANTGFIQIEDI